MRLFALFLSATLATAAATAQETAPHPLEPFYGTWVGTAEGFDADRQPFTLTQTERVGPMLDGDIAVIEGRGYQADGTLDFNAFAVVSCFEAGGACEMRSYNDGRAGTFVLEPTGDGFVWTIEAGPSARIVYTATLAGETWTEVGKYHPGGGNPVEIFRMVLTRTGDTDWPVGGAVMPK